MAQPLGKPFDSQQTLGFNIIPKRRTIDPGLNELTVFFLRDRLAPAEMS